MILPAFDKFPTEAAHIGRMLAGYGELEIELMHCVLQARDDLDAIMKAMFRPRGESQRIDIADALGRSLYESWGLGTHFAEVIGAVRYCLKIRNQFAHCTWYGENNQMLAFVNLEDIAELNSRVTDFKGATKLHVNVPLLEAQLAYFNYAQEMMFFVRYGLMVALGHIQSSPYPKAPTQPKRPALNIV